VRRELRALFIAVGCGAGLIFVGLIVGRPTFTVRGAYFDRSVGVPTFAGVSANSGTGLFDPSDGNLWIGAGIAVLLITAVCVVLVRRWRANTDRVEGPATEL
jgi:hypothetical protein